MLTPTPASNSESALGSGQDLLSDLPGKPKMLDIHDALRQYDRRIREAVELKLQRCFQSFNYGGMAILAALRGQYSDMELDWVIEQAKLKSESPKGIGGLIMAMLRRGQRPDRSAPVVHKMVYPAAVDHLRHALDQLGLGHEDKHANLIDRLTRRWAPVTDHLLRHAYPGASALDLLHWCLEQGNEHGSVDPDCKKPALIMSVLKLQMGQLADEWEAAVTNREQGKSPTLSLPVNSAGLATGWGLILTGDPDMDTVLGPRNAPWAPGERDQVMRDRKAERDDAEQKMRDTGLAPDGTPYPVVQVRRQLDKLRTCEAHMVESHLSSLKVLQWEIESARSVSCPGAHTRDLNDEWTQTVINEVSEVYRDLERRGLVERPTAGQSGNQLSSVETEGAPMDLVVNTPPPGPDELAAAIASLVPESETPPAEPVGAAHAVRLKHCRLRPGKRLATGRTAA